MTVFLSIRLVGLLSIGVLVPALQATEDALELIPLPLDTRQVEIKVAEVPFVIGMSMPESAFVALNRPYVPPSVSFNEQEDINMASLAGIKVTPTQKSDDGYAIDLDYAKVKDEHRTEELLTAVVECIHRIASRDDGYRVEITLSNLPEDSELHALLKRLMEQARKKAASPATKP